MSGYKYSRPGDYLDPVLPAAIKARWWRVAIIVSGEVKRERLGGERIREGGGPPQRHVEHGKRCVRARVCVSFRCVVVMLEIAVGVAGRDTICGHGRRVNLQFAICNFTIKQRFGLKRSLTLREKHPKRKIDFTTFLIKMPEQNVQSHPLLIA